MVYDVSSAYGGDESELGFLVSTEAIKSMVVIFFLYVAYLANDREDIVDFGTEGVEDAGSILGGFRIPED